MDNQEEKNSNKKYSLFFSILIAFLTFIAVGFTTKFSEEPFVKILPAISAYLIFKFLRNQESSSNESIDNDEIDNDEIRIKNKKTGEIKTIKRTDWRKIIDEGDNNLYEVIYN